MMLYGPLLVALIPGGFILLLTWWLAKKRLSLLLISLPSLITIVVALVLFYIGIVEIRGFEGAAYGFLSIFLITFAIISLILAKKTKASL